MILPPSAAALALVAVLVPNSLAQTPADALPGSLSGRWIARPGAADFEGEASMNEGRIVVTVTGSPRP